MPSSYILDTSLFVNPDSSRFYGNNPTAAFKNFLIKIDQIEDLDFLMPPSIYRELMYFADEKELPENILLRVKQRAPKKHELQVPGIFIYELVEDMRGRVDRGLRLAERHVREALAAEPPSPVEKKNPAQHRADASAVSRLRETYRRIMREGSLDSRADVDLLLLTYELEGTLISADQGVLDWAEKLGLSVLPHHHLPALLEKASSQS